MSTFAPWSTTPDWLAKAARDAAAVIARGVVRSEPEQRLVADRAQRIIIDHISAAFALQRIDIKPPAGPEENHSFWSDEL